MWHSKQELNRQTNKLRLKVKWLRLEAMVSREGIKIIQLFSCSNIKL